VACYVQGEKFDKARDCSQSVRNQDLFNKLNQFIDAKEAVFLKVYSFSLFKKLGFPNSLM